MSFRKPNVTKPQKQSVSTGTGVKLSYAEVVGLHKGCDRDQSKKQGFFKAINRNPPKQHQSRDWKEEKGSGRIEDWSRIVVCTRESLWDEWSKIQASINRLYSTNIILQPFQPDKALFCCKNKKEAEFFGSKGLLFISGPFTIRLEEWNKGDVLLNKKTSFIGGWIEVVDLPLIWWKQEVFEAIGDRCGGLVQIDRRTEPMHNLFSPRIKVRGLSSGFIPTEVDLVIGEEYFAVRLIAISRLNFEHRKRKRLPLELDLF